MALPLWLKSCTNKEESLMPDMLVKLYDLPDEAPALARSRAFGAVSYTHLTLPTSSRV